MSLYSSILEKSASVNITSAIVGWRQCKMDKKRLSQSEGECAYRSAVVDCQGTDKGGNGHWDVANTSDLNWSEVEGRWV